MIDGFEEYTDSLNEYERKVLLPEVARHLRTRIGDKMAISNRDICHLLSMNDHKGINGARVRKIINYIRRRNIVKRLAASSKGYYVCKDTMLYVKYMKSLMARRNAIGEVLHCILDCEGLTEEDLTY